jgi:hypothetical protein
VEIVQAYQKNAKLKWANDNSLSILCLSYNQIRPIDRNNKVEKKQADEDKFLRKSNVGSYFVPYGGCVVIMAYPEMNHPAKIIALYDYVAGVQYTSDKSVNHVPYARMIPVLDVEIPRAKRRKLDQFCYILNYDNSQQEYLDVERLRKQPSSQHTITVIDNLSCNGRLV